MKKYKVVFKTLAQWLKEQKPAAKVPAKKEAKRNGRRKGRGKQKGKNRLTRAAVKAVKTRVKKIKTGYVGKGMKASITRIQKYERQLVKLQKRLIKEKQALKAML